MPTHPPITVLLAHFDDLFARGLRVLLESDPSLVVLAADVEHARIPVVLQAHHPDVAILDVGALGKLAEVRALSERYPATRLVLIGEEITPVESAQLLAFGASACLGRNTQSRDVINAIHLASRGLQVMPRLAEGEGRPVLAGSDRLTRREAEVLPLLQGGRTNAQIALALGVGVETVRTHARNIYRKLGVSSRHELLTSRRDDSPEEPAHPSERLPRRRALASARSPRRGHESRHR